MATLMAARSKVRNIPTTMKAAAIDRFGPPKVLTLHELPTPQAGPGEVLIAIHAAGVGVWDADIRGGWWPFGKPKFPIVLGHGRRRRHRGARDGRAAVQGRRSRVGV